MQSQSISNIIDQLLRDVPLFKITLSKPRLKGSSLKNIYVKPIATKDGLRYHATYRHQTNDQVKVYTFEEALDEIGRQLENEVYNADIFTADHQTTILQSKKGKITVLKKEKNTVIEPETHDKIKQRLIPATSKFLFDLGLTSAQGNVLGPAQDKYRQINKYVELISNLLGENNESLKIVDMGSGKGYLTFALYDHLSSKNHNPNVTGIEMRKDLVDKCNSIAQKNEMLNLSFEEGSIDTIDIGVADMVIALHACDIATDMAIAKGIEAKAKYIVMAPCCHKQIRKEMRTNNKSVLNPLLKHGILKERQAEMVTDTIRALLLEAKGYAVKVFEFISAEHTGKNVMITAEYKGNQDHTALDKVEKLKTEFGINQHYLEHLLD